jgi:hypothetical protein|tara:strand:- start:2144 stop:2275 length:132 start_codon:yes stop_codon:yes gene_type:complete
MVKIIARENDIEMTIESLLKINHLFFVRVHADKMLITVTKVLQ